MGTEVSTTCCSCRLRTVPHFVATLQDKTLCVDCTIFQARPHLDLTKNTHGAQPLAVIKEEDEDEDVLLVDTEQKVLRMGLQTLLAQASKVDSPSYLLSVFSSVLRAIQAPIDVGSRLNASAYTIQIIAFSGIFFNSSIQHSLIRSLLNDVRESAASRLASFLRSGYRSIIIKAALAALLVMGILFMGRLLLCINDIHLWYQANTMGSDSYDSGWVMLDSRMLCGGVDTARSVDFIVPT